MHDGELSRFRSNECGTFGTYGILNKILSACYHLKYKLKSGSQG
jgi:hypothetical protein